MDYFLITIDVEDWFQVENFKGCIPYSSWSTCELRIERNTNLLLDSLDEINAEGPSTSSPLRCTFFVLGWIAERLPKMVEAIHNRGHEVASHGYFHNLCGNMHVKDLQEDLLRSKELLEDIIGNKVWGYRAPSFSIDAKVLELIRECGYLYDSSYNSFGLHGRYGKLEIENCKTGTWKPVFEPVAGLYELPISNLCLRGQTLPWGGGAYFRLVPEKLFQQGVRHLLQRWGTYVMYIHPWEFDPAQPHVQAVSAFRRFRHYTNLHKTLPRLKKLILKFSDCSFISCHNLVNIDRFY